MLICRERCGDSYVDVYSGKRIGREIKRSVYNITPRVMTTSSGSPLHGGSVGY